MIFCASHRVIFSLRESDIETYGFSDIIFAFKIRKANITWTLVQISLRSNITRRKANITEKLLVLSNREFFWDRHSKWNRSKNLIFFNFQNHDQNTKCQIPNYRFVYSITCHLLHKMYCYLHRK